MEHFSTQPKRHISAQVTTWSDFLCFPFPLSSFHLTTSKLTHCKRMPRVVRRASSHTPRGNVPVAGV